MASRDNPGPKRSRAALFGTGMLGVLIAISVSLTPAGETLDWQGRDLLLRFRGPRSTTAKVVVIAIADSTLEAWPEPMLPAAARIPPICPAGCFWKRCAEEG